MDEDRIKLTIHGLDVHKDRVKAVVFISKMRALLLALRAADREINQGEVCFDYLISDLEIGSAQAEFREIQFKSKRRSRASSVTLVKTTARSVYEGTLRDAVASRPLLKYVQALGRGAQKTFSHAELTTKENDVDAVRIDEFFELQSVVASDLFRTFDASPTAYRGRALCHFDGILKEVDLRGTVARAKLITTAGSKEIDCVCNEVTVENLRSSLDRRSFVEGYGHYDGADLLPVRVDIKRIQIAKENPDLQRWRGCFEFPLEYADEDV